MRFRFTDFSLDPFDFSSWETAWRGSVQWVLNCLRAFQLICLDVCESQKLFWRFILNVRRALLRNWSFNPTRPPRSAPPPPIPTPAHRSGRKVPAHPKIPFRHCAHPPMLSPLTVAHPPSATAAEPSAPRSFERNSPDVRGVMFQLLRSRVRW